MDAAIVYHWSGTKPGREAASVALMNEVSEVMGHMQATGRITDFAWFIGAQGGPHVMVVRGDGEALMGLSADRAIMALTTRAMIVNEDFGWGFYATGDAAQAQAGLFLEMATHVMTS
jgi:hypothetical protein